MYNCCLYRNVYTHKLFLTHYSYIYYGMQPSLASHSQSVSQSDRHWDCYVLHHVSKSVSQTLKLLCFTFRQSVCQSARHWGCCVLHFAIQSVSQSDIETCVLYDVSQSARHWNCCVLHFANQSISQPDIETVVFYISPISLSVSQTLRLLCFTFRQSVCQSARHWDMLWVFLLNHTEYVISCPQSHLYYITWQTWPTYQPNICHQSAEKRWPSAGSVTSSWPSAHRQSWLYVICRAKRKCTICLLLALQSSATFWSLRRVTIDSQQ